MKEDKVATMLALIEERLAAYSLDETLDRLHSYGGEGPTIEEYYSSFSVALPKLINNIDIFLMDSDVENYEVCLEGLGEPLECRFVDVACNDDDYQYSTHDPYEFNLAA